MRRMKSGQMTVEIYPISFQVPGVPVALQRYRSALASRTISLSGDMEVGCRWKCCRRASELDCSVCARCVDTDPGLAEPDDAHSASRAAGRRPGAVGRRQAGQHEYERS